MTAKLNGGKGYADLKLVDAYVKEGRLPAIHDNMGAAMAFVPQAKRQGALDLGACTGLLSIRARLMGWHTVIGVEADKGAVDTYDEIVAPYAKIKGENPLTVEHRALDVSSQEFALWLASRTGAGTINTILARRVFPELFSNAFPDGKQAAVWRRAGLAFGYAARAAGIEYIVLEGRQWKNYKTHANPLYKLEIEQEALGPGWRQAFRHKECAVMVPA